MGLPLVKVVVTTYNRPLWLRRALEGVLSQTHPNVHVVVVDDASTDDTPLVADEYANAYPDRVSVVLKDLNLGPADSILEGIASGPDAPYVAFLNDDDWWYPKKLERQLKLFERNPRLGLVFCEAHVVDELGAWMGQMFSERHGGQLDAARPFEDLLVRNCACASSLMITREIADIARWTMPSPSRVWDYHIVLVAAGHADVAWIREPLLAYTVAPGGVHKQTFAMWRDTTRMRRHVLQLPAISARLGGRRAADRKASLLTLDVAVMMLRERAWREYLWHSRRVISGRSLRPVVWLLLHTLRVIAGSGLGGDARRPG